MQFRDTENSINVSESGIWARMTVIRKILESFGPCQTFRRGSYLVRFTPSYWSPKEEHCR
jgi:hypothetical protein